MRRRACSGYGCQLERYAAHGLIEHPLVIWCCPTDSRYNGNVDIDVLVQCAGPFKYTVRPFIESCIRTKTHYFDITGEIEVFEYIFTKDKEAKEAGMLSTPSLLLSGRCQII
jgi:hypothetical protein